MDIKISLEIGLSPELSGFLGKLVGEWPQQPKAAAEKVKQALDQPEAVQAELRAETADAQDPQPEAQRRTRRTKAQMEADAAATQGTDGSSETDQPDAGSAPAEAPATDLAAALGAEDPEAREGVTAKADVAAKMQEAMAATSPKKVQDRMATDLGGAKRLSEIDPSLYGKAIETFDAIIAGA